MSLGPMEVILILAVILIFFGPKRLPGLGKSLGEGIRSFKEGLSPSNTDKINAPPQNPMVNHSPDNNKPS